MIEKKPFVCYTLDEDKKKSKDQILCVRLNPEDQKELAELKKILGIKADSKALKVAAFCCKNFLNTFFRTKHIKNILNA